MRTLASVALLLLSTPASGSAQLVSDRASDHLESRGWTDASTLTRDAPAGASAPSHIDEIHEEGFLPIGGIEQWVTINGADRTSPVILFLHGGPGSPLSPYADAIYGEWETDFVLVQWDQRGAGRTFGRNAPAAVDEEYWIEHPLTVAQMTADGIELSEYLIRHLGAEKLILIGTSWGSVLGAMMASERPDLFHAVMGHSQVVAPAAAFTHAFGRVQGLARSGDDQETIEILSSLGPPPYGDARSAGQLLRIIKRYEQERSVAAPDSWSEIGADYDNPVDGRHRFDGDDYSFIHYIGHEALGIGAMSGAIDLAGDAVRFAIPVYLIQGVEDITTPMEITAAYFEEVEAPSKELFVIEGAAHGLNRSVVDLQRLIVTDRLSAIRKE